MPTRPLAHSYVEGSGGIFKDMAVPDLDMSRFLMGEEPEAILAYGACMIDKEILKLPGAEAFDTASVIIKYPGGKHACIDVCRQAPYGYDQRAEVLGTKGMIQVRPLSCVVCCAWCVVCCVLCVVGVLRSTELGN